VEGQAGFPDKNAVKYRTKSKLPAMPTSAQPSVIRHASGAMKNPTAMAADHQFSSNPSIA
jgi:hypothetical protein